MSTKCSHATGALLLEQAGTFSQCPTRVAYVINEDYIAICYITNDYHAGNFIRSFTVLIAYHHFTFKIARYFPNSVGTSNIWGSKSQIFKIQSFNIGYKNRRRVQVINWN